MIEIGEFPDEIILHIVSFLSPESSIWALAQSNRHLYAVCSPCLYRYNVVYGDNTALDWAAQNGNMVTFQTALDVGAPLLANPQFGKTMDGPVINAYGMNVRRRVYEECRTRPASLAAIGGHEEMIRFMTGRGVNVNLRDGDGFTLLAFACIYGHTSLARFLLSQGARQRFHSHMSHYPLRLAVYHGYEDIVDLLIEDLKQRWADGVLEQIEDAVCGAVVAGLTSMVRYLVEHHNAPVTFVLYHGYGRTPLMQAAGDVRADMVRLLLQLGVEVDAGSSLSPRQGLSPLSPLAEAGRGNHQDVAQTLVGLSPPIVRTRELATSVQEKNFPMAEMYSIMGPILSSARTFPNQKPMQMKAYGYSHCY
jgi:ankyrin repeat protein